MKLKVDQNKTIDKLVRRKFRKQTQEVYYTASTLAQDGEASVPSAVDRTTIVLREPLIYGADANIP